MSVESFWFGPAERPLFGHLHVSADARARGGVVVCPPVGIEASHAQHTLRLLARALEAAGFLVLRFDYDGTGQSAGDMSDPGRVAAWLASVREAARLVRECGVGWLGGVGFRLGATLLANAGVDALDAAVLSEPCPSGAAFLREQQMLRLGLVPELREELDGVAAPGYVFPDETAADLRELALPDALPGRRVLVLTDPLRPSSAELGRRLAGSCHVAWQPYASPSDLYDTGAAGWRPPLALVEQQVAWLDGACDAEPVPVSVPRTARSSAVVGSAGDTADVVETPVRLGPAQLFGVRCEPTRSAGVGLPTVLFLSIAAESSIGPARQWVELGRRLAGSGFRSARFDLSGIGESPARPGRAEGAIYGVATTEDIADAAAAVSPSDPGNVVLVGVCSGAYAALAGTPQLHPRATVAVNPLLSFAGHEYRGAADQAPPENGVRRIGGIARGSAWRSRLGDRLPPSLWRLVYALGLAHSPARLLAPVIESGTPTLLVCGEEEAHVPTRRTPAALARLTGASRFVELPELNHGLLHASNRRVVGDLLVDYLRGLFTVDGS